MKTISILRVLINILFFLLLTALVVGFVYFLILMFFPEVLPFYLRGFRMLFSSQFFNWKISLIPIVSVINFILFVISIFYLKRCVKPFSRSDFYTLRVIRDLKKAGNIFIFIGVSTLLIRFISIALFQTIAKSFIGTPIVFSFLSSFDATVLFSTIIGLFLLLFSNAFENARELKEENNLTI